jgi:hypothetical protein
VAVKGVTGVFRLHEKLAGRQEGVREASHLLCRYDHMLVTIKSRKIGSGNMSGDMSKAR